MKSEVNFSEEDGTSIYNEDTKEFYMRKNARIYSILQLLKSPRKNKRF